ncbi:MAG: hypothetical protein IM494_12200 [Microcystis sp. M034S2]|nr:hypothetical protein [Microcystis sp. M034S2]
MSTGKNSISDIFADIVEAILFIFLRRLVTNPLFI